MNLKRASIFCTLCLLLNILSCEKEIFDCGNGEGIREVRTVTLDAINGFDISEGLVLIIKEGESQNIQINSYPNLIEKILDDSKVENGIWKIDVDHCLSGLEKDDVEIIATITALTKIEISGSADVRTHEIFENVDNLDLDISGSGDMDLALGSAIQNIDTKISGSGKINLSGATIAQDINISGSGDYRAFSLASNTCKIKISGSGNCQVSVEELLDVDISGSGDVCYRGNPIIDSQTTGSGDVNNCN